MWNKTIKKIGITLFISLMFYVPNIASATTACEDAVKYLSEGDNLFAGKRYFEAIDKYNKGLYGCSEFDVLFTINFNLAVAYGKTNGNKNAALYFEKALKYTTDDKEIKDIKVLIEYYQALAKDEDLKSTSATNDPYSYKQYYLRSLSITSAWKQITAPKEVIVAVIDDGVWINAPDLKHNIIGEVVDFTGDGLKNYTEGNHGTMVSGIIAAETDNNIGVAGIAKNIKIMPLRVFGSGTTASEETLIEAINYAVKNKANIINISLGQSQFYGTSKFDVAIKNAYDKGVIVVIAAGNGDLLSSNQIGLDTTSNPVYPVCNNGGSSQYSFGVGASQQNGDNTNWSNYGSCVSFWLPGENITSISVPQFSNDYGYDTADGTSFSTPILSGIIALGYNKYGYVPFEIIKTELQNSISDFFWEKVTGSNKVIKVINAEKYLANLGIRIEEIHLAQEKLEGAKKQNIEIPKITPSSQDLESSTLDTGTILTFNGSVGDYLAASGIVKKQDSEDLYRMDDYVLRQEVISMAIKLGGVTLPQDYICKGYYKDVSRITPNTWACRAIEISADNGVVTRQNDLFRPEDKITKAEALAIILRGSKIEIPQSTSSYFLDVNISWQANIVNAGINNSIIDTGSYFFPNQNATRGEIFEMAKRVLLGKK